MAESTVKAVSPVITLTMDLMEAVALRELLTKVRNDRPAGEHRWPLSSVYDAVREGVANGERIIKGGIEAVSTP